MSKFSYTKENALENIHKKKSKIQPGKYTNKKISYKMVNKRDVYTHVTSRLYSLVSFSHFFLLNSDPAQKSIKQSTH